MGNHPANKIMVFDEGHPVFFQLMTKAKELFPEEGTEFVRLALPEGTGASAAGPAAVNHMAVIDLLETAVREEAPDVLLMGATALGEEAAPALGVRLGTGVAAHCNELERADDGRLACMVPAFGGRVIGEIFIPDTKPAIATVKPGVFEGDADSAGGYRDHICSLPDGAGGVPESCGGVTLTGCRPRQNTSEALEKAKIIVCGGFGIGSEEGWKKIEMLAEKLGGAAGCTRPVVDMEWGPDEYSMIGTSGRTVKPKVYIGFGISGAAHHLCGIKDADVIISINKDKEAEVFSASDYAGVFDAGKMLDELLGSF